MVGHGFSGVSLGNSFLNLLNGKLGTNVSTPNAVTLGQIGPATDYVGAGTNVATTFSGNSTANDTVATIAVIVQFDTLQFAGLFGATGSATAGYTLMKENGAGDLLMLRMGSTNANSTIGLITGVPYFVVASATGTANINFVVTTLTTGLIRTSTGTASAATAPDGTYIVGNLGGTSLNASAAIAAAMYSPQYMSMSALVAWARDPWEFWYPRSLDRPNMVGVASGVGYTLALAQGSYALTGKTQTLNSARNIAAAQGSYSQTGQAQTLNKGRGLAAVQGSYSVTGQAQTLNRGINITSAQGSYAVTGQAQTLAVGLPAAQGSYAVTGKPQTFAVALSGRPVTGNYAVTGFPQVLTYSQFGAVGTSFGNKFIADMGQMTSKI